VLGLIKRNSNLGLLCRDSFVMLYKSMVRSHIEYANAVWNPHREGLIKDLERVQMRATKLVPGLKKKCYKERLMALKLPTLKYRRIRGDMIEVYKLLTNMYDDNTVQLGINSDARTRGHTKKLVVKRCRYDVRKFSFSNRITNILNSLPDEIISAPTVNTFKNRLDRFWAEQEVFYNYKAHITGNKGVNLYYL